MLQSLLSRFDGDSGIASILKSCALIVVKQLDFAMKRGETNTPQKATVRFAATFCQPLRYSGGDVIVLCGLAAIGFSLPWFLKDAGGILHVVSTYIIPVAVAGFAVAYDPWSEHVFPSAEHLEFFLTCRLPFY